MPDFQSEIRSGDIDLLEDKVRRDNYGKYLKRVTLRRVRGFVDR